MRKDSRILLEKIVEHRNKIAQDSFELNIRCFKEIPNIETAIKDIVKDLINNNCLTGKSQVNDTNGDISFYLTLDGITYFDEEEKTSSVVFNVSGGQVNFAKDNGCIEGHQNNNLIQDNQKEKMNEEWMDIINTWCEFIDIDNWKEWTFYLLDAGLPRLFVKNAERLEEFREWMFKKVWPEGYEEIKGALNNFYWVLNDFLNLYHKHSEQRGKIYFTERFYHIDQWDTELYDKLLLEFKNHVRLLDDMVLELTRAGNYVCDMVRKYLNPEFRLKEGKLVVKTGPDGDMNYDILRPEYKEENLKDKMLYRGIEQFKEDRCKRDFFWGEEKEDGNF